ncbi:MAG: sensor histidine kinase, partial [Bacteroidota bacterium]
PSDRGKLFTPFKQLDMGLTRRAQGTGLGLSICKGLIEAHGGTIEVENAREGRGTCFRFRLPCNQASQHSK